MTQPGIEPWSPRPLENTLPNWLVKSNKKGKISFDILKYQYNLNIRSIIISKEQVQNIYNGKKLAVFPLNLLLLLIFSK